MHRDTVAQVDPPGAPSAAEGSQPVLVVGSPLGDVEVVMLNPERPRGGTPARMSLTEVLALGLFVFVVAATIIGGVHLGYSFRGWIAQTGNPQARAMPPAEDSRREVDLAKSLPTGRRADRTSPVRDRRARSTAGSGVDRMGQVPSRMATPQRAERAPKVPVPAGADERQAWVRLTALMRDGISLHREGWYGPAMARFREAVAVTPGYLRAHLWLGRSGIKAGRFGEARQALHQVIVLDPESAVAQEARALLAQIEKDT